MAKKSSEVTARYIFETMEYGTVKENLDLAEAWFKKTEIKVHNTEEAIKNVIALSEEQSKIWHKTPSLTKAKLLNKLACELETYSTLLCQIELKSRNILTKDTKNKSIQIFVDYVKYYAGWAVTCEKYFPNLKPYGSCASFMSEDTPLSIFAAILAAALAAGNTIIFGVSGKFIPVACFILELCKNVGFPDGTISFIEINDPHIILQDDTFKKITYIGNLYDKNFESIFFDNMHAITSLHLGKCSSIVFDSADLDSACDSIVQNSWGYGGMFPCGINQVFVQENIYKDFVNRIKSRIEKLNVGYENNVTDKTCDIIINKQTYKANEMIDVINKVPLQLGHKNFGNNVICEEKTNDVLSILAFRTANEAIQLVNNNKYGLGCSVWTENISLTNEVTNKLKVGMIWINTHGNISANASFSPFKGSGNGHFGGKDGLLEYLTSKNPIKYQRHINFKISSMETHLPKAINKRILNYHSGGFKKSESGLTDDNFEHANQKDVRNCVENAKKSYETWNKVQSKTRAQSLTKLAELSASIKSQITDKWIEYLFEWSTFVNQTESFFQSNPNLKVVKEALGVVVVELYHDTNYSCLQLIAAAIAYGNAVIVLNYSDEMIEFLENLCKIIASSGIPAGVFNAFFNFNPEIYDCLSSHREIQTYFMSDTVCDAMYGFINIPHMKNIDNVEFSSYKNVLNVVTKNKLIWTSVGESFL